ncbi:DnaJ domain-containing protein [Glaciimonas sp. PCH181]|uniref:J domain-containing protein n=1 Tax=Glaciimonas sp. PCH181 TaxID=2133943 RepID=UPI000D3C4BBF|nr:DnaJ domain-containing protein [Glaciimonas sp. PCH181]PUA17168.1 hypothetical protein C7W93_14585 [Glaciimonas sp. PCH181]
MTTLYEILGLSLRATAEQVEQAYTAQTRKLETEGPSPEHNKAQLMAIKEAYAVLSSEARRAAYDAKLNKTTQVSYEVAASGSLPWLSICLVSSVLVVGTLYFYKTQDNQDRIDQFSLATEKSKADAKTALLKVYAEKASLQKAKLLDDQHAADRQRKNSEQARLEGQQIHLMLEQPTEAKARDDAQAARQAKYGQRQNATTQLALNMPTNR